MSTLYVDEESVHSARQTCHVCEIALCQPHHFRRCFPWL